ncbi:MAG: zinc-binding dehydrogenase [Actinobacteria bacterium]|nr:zinc-binding dehydrogenase [Actinomycetota bacterium]
MKAAFLVSKGVVEIRDVPKPTISEPNQVLIKNKLSTICGSDTHVVWDTKPESWWKTPGYPGHESVGVVEKSTDPSLQIGDLVLCVPNLKHAGGFAEYQLLPSSLVISIPSDSKVEMIILAQQLGTVIYGMKRFHATVGNGTVAILGAGPVGLFFTSLCKLAGFKEIIVSDLHLHRLAVAKQMGATKTVLAKDDAVVDAVRKMTEDGAWLVIDAAGKDVTRIQCIHCVATSGRIGYFGMPEGPDMTLPFEKLYRRKPTVEFSWDAQAEPGHASFREALEAIRSGRVDVSPITVKVWPLEELSDALHAVHNSEEGFVKAGIGFD